VRHPAGFEHVSWHSFARETFDLGRESFADIGDLHLYVYSAERTIIDSFRLAYREGGDAANTALRRWVSRRGNSPSSLLRLAEAFPKAAPSLRQALEVLL
jgi:hypothetical protein